VVGNPEFDCLQGQEILIFSQLHHLISFRGVAKGDGLSGAARAAQSKG
jgi:hypothetical protein